MHNYRIIYECQGRVKSFEGSIRAVYTLSMQDFTSDFVHFRINKVVLFKNSVLMCSGYYAVSQYLDDELSNVIRQSYK